jgi:hypothetical protein
MGTQPQLDSPKYRTLAVRELAINKDRGRLSQQENDVWLSNGMYRPLNHLACREFLSVPKLHD